MRSNTSLVDNAASQLATRRQDSPQEISSKALTKIRPDTTAGAQPSHGTAEPYHVLPLAGTREDNESGRAVVACNDWLRMGRGRLLRKLITEYSQAHSKPSETLQNTPESKPPTLSYDTLRDWSQKFHWRDRSALYDFEWEKKRTEIAYAQMHTGLALTHNRMREIEEIYSILKGELMEIRQNPDGEEVFCNLWLETVKFLRDGKSVQKHGAPLQQRPYQRPAKLAQ